MAEKTLVRRAGWLSLVLAILVFVANMGAAWWITSESTDVISQPLITEQATVASRVLDSAQYATANSHILLNRMLDSELMLRSAQNRHTITVVSLSVAFALLAIGFALFVMGAEGAFEFTGEVEDKGNLLIKATAPGLLCFVLAMIIVVFALMSKTELKVSEFTVFPDAAQSQSGNEHADAGGASGGEVHAVQATQVTLAPTSEPVRAEDTESAVD